MRSSERRRFGRPAEAAIVRWPQGVIRMPRPQLVQGPIASLVLGAIVVVLGILAMGRLLVAMLGQP